MTHHLTVHEIITKTYKECLQITCVIPDLQDIVMSYLKMSDLNRLRQVLLFKFETFHHEVSLENNDYVYIRYKNGKGPEYSNHINHVLDWLNSDLLYQNPIEDLKETYFEIRRLMFTI